MEIKYFQLEFSLNYFYLINIGECFSADPLLKIGIMSAGSMSADEGGEEDTTSWSLTGSSCIGVLGTFWIKFFGVGSFAIGVCDERSFRLAVFVERPFEVVGVFGVGS
jgi:hypothetical protein